MTTLAPCFSMKKCPPGVAHGALEAEPVFKHRLRPVSAEVDGAGYFHTPGIDFSDYARMQTMQRKTSGERRLPTPSWAVNQAELRALLVVFFERRAGIRTPGTGSLIQRLNEAQRKLLAKIPAKVAVIDHLCREYMAVKSTDPARARLLQSEIQNLDTCIRMAKMGPGGVARMVTLYYSVGLDSVGTASEIGITPPHVRQTLWRLNQIAAAPPKAPAPPNPKRFIPFLRTPKLCVICGKEFSPMKTQKTCSPECRQENRRRKRA